MERAPFEQFVAVAESKSISIEKDVVERITENSSKFDREVTATRAYTPEEIKKAWQIREWKIGDTTIKAIGVSHVPETFLEYRQEIEKAIQESDVVVNEFAPEAIGLYDKESAPRLRGIKSKLNEHYNLEQLRQAYLTYEREWNIGTFHHEVELLVAKYGKDMATADLTFSKDSEGLMQSDSFFTYAAEKVSERIARFKKGGLYGSAAAIGITSLGVFLDELRKPISRRKFLSLGLMAGAAALAGVTPKLTETPPRTENKPLTQKQVFDKFELQKLRDARLAEAIWRLTEAGYKNIAFIYGTMHLKRVEDYLNDPKKGAKELEAGKEVIQRNNPDSFRLYRISEGSNHSEKFVASEKKVWKRVPVGK